MNDLAATHFVLSVWVFQRLMGLVYVIAFLSLAVQIKGLAGVHGIMPASLLIKDARHIRDWRRYLLNPTVFWLGSSDRILQATCWIGVALGILFALGVAPVVVAPLLWILYLSFLTVCPLFLGYQWDILLVETGFLTVFLTPCTFLDWPPQHAPSLIMLGLAYLLLFRLMFFSGCVKLRSRDAAWRSCTALRFHYETQPLPNRVSWYAHWMPCWLHRFSAGVLFVIELAVPFLYFTPAPWRYAAGLATIALMLLISLTGSYGFFNLLTVVLCVPLFDDAIWEPVFRWFGASWMPVPIKPASWPVWLLSPLAAVVLFLNFERFADLFSLKLPVPLPLRKVVFWLRPLALVNSYGLFAVMTTSRPEIIVQGSKDDEHWLTYEFKWKPGDLNRAPRHPAPHQPRLDWQMWFAALSPLHYNPWFVNFLVCLLENRPEVTRLLHNNPFAECPPRYVRALLYDYHFSNPRKPDQKNAWWQRELLAIYCPRLQLRPEPEQPSEEMVEARPNDTGSSES